MNRDELRERLKHARNVGNVEYCIECDTIASFREEGYPDFHPEACWENDHTVLTQGQENAEINAWLDCLDYLEEEVTE